MKKKCQYFPITAFAIIMGLSGMTIVLDKFSQIDIISPLFFEGALFLTVGLFVLFLLMYLIKLLRFPSEVREDVNHRIRINFFSTISISFLLLSIAFLGFHKTTAEFLWYIGVGLHTFLMFYTVSYWIKKNIDIKFMNPAWFIPVVGNMLVPIAGVQFMPKEINFFFFVTGFFFWIILFVIFLNRVIFHHQLPQKFMPTLLILIAPPSIGFISYIKITNSFDYFATSLLFMAYFFVILILFLYQSFLKLKFYISWWAFTFPIMSVTIASLLAFHKSQELVYKYFSFGFFAIGLIVIVLVTLKTLIMVKKGELCVKEE